MIYVSIVVCFWQLFLRYIPFELSFEVCSQIIQLFLKLVGLYKVCFTLMSTSSEVCNMIIVKTCRCISNCYGDLINPTLDCLFENQFEKIDDAKKLYDYSWSLLREENRTDEPVNITRIGLFQFTTTYKLRKVIANTLSVAFDVNFILFLFATFAVVDNGRRRFLIPHLFLATGARYVIQSLVTDKLSKAASFVTSTFMTGGLPFGGS